MADVKKINFDNGDEYDIKDEEARNQIQELNETLTESALWNKLLAYGGIAITDGDNLNDYRAAGLYRTTTTATTTSLVNCPVSSGAFSLFVVNQGSGFRIQFLIAAERSSARALYYRLYINSVWGSWYYINGSLAQETEQ